MFRNLVGIEIIDYVNFLSVSLKGIRLQAVQVFLWISFFGCHVDLNNQEKDNLNKNILG